MSRVKSPQSQCILQPPTQNSLAELDKAADLCTLAAHMLAVPISKCLHWSFLMDRVSLKSVHRLRHIVSLLWHCTGIRAEQEGRSYPSRNYFSSSKSLPCMLLGLAAFILCSPSSWRICFTLHSFPQILRAPSNTFPQVWEKMCIRETFLSSPASSMVASTKSDIHSALRQILWKLFFFFIF